MNKLSSVQLYWSGCRLLSAQRLLFGLDIKRVSSERQAVKKELAVYHLVGALMYKKEDGTGPDWFSHFRRYLSSPEDLFIVELNKKKKNQVLLSSCKHCDIGKENCAWCKQNGWEAIIPCLPSNELLVDIKSYVNIKCTQTTSVTMSCQNGVAASMHTL